METFKTYDEAYIKYREINRENNEEELQRFWVQYNNSLKEMSERHRKQYEE